MTEGSNFFRGVSGFIFHPFLLTIRLSFLNESVGSLRPELMHFANTMDVFLPPSPVSVAAGAHAVRSAAAEESATNNIPPAAVVISHAVQHTVNPAAWLRRLS